MLHQYFLKDELELSTCWVSYAWGVTTPPTVCDSLYVYLFCIKAEWQVNEQTEGTASDFCTCCKRDGDLPLYLMCSQPAGHLVVFIWIGFGFSIIQFRNDFKMFAILCSPFLLQPLSCIATQVIGWLYDGLCMIVQVKDLKLSHHVLALSRYKFMILSANTEDDSMQCFNACLFYILYLSTWSMHGLLILMEAHVHGFSRFMYLSWGRFVLVSFHANTTVAD